MRTLPEPIIPNEKTLRKNTARLFAVNGHFLRHVSDDEHNQRLASGQCVPYYKGAKYMGIKFAQQVHEECSFGLPSGVESATGLTTGDIFRNAAGVVDTAKRSQVYKMREEGKIVSAAIRAYGRTKNDKPDRNLIGNTVDRSMSRVEQWPHASESNRAVTCVPGGVVGITEMTAKELASLQSLAL